MSVTIEWDNDNHTIVRMEMVGSWTWDEAYAGAERGYTMLESVGYEVGVIMDFSRSAGLPPGALANARRMIQRRHPRTGLTVFVGANTLFISLWNVFAKVYTLFAQKQNSVFAPTVEEARRMLAQRYPRVAQESGAQPGDEAGVV
ncbi:MAG: hypothetical protein HZC41_02455 [Chloroflexi bacterium]|nr:hypothetical protein [Chloroflexota bacterium]